MRFVTKTYNNTFMPCRKIVGFRMCGFLCSKHNSKQLSYTFQFCCWKNCNKYCLVLFYIQLDIHLIIRNMRVALLFLLCSISLSSANMTYWLNFKKSSLLYIKINNSSILNKTLLSKLIYKY